MKTEPAVDAEHFLFEPRHAEFRALVRDFLQREVNPYGEQWERDERFPKTLFARAGEAGLFRHGVPQEFGGTGIDCRMAIIRGEEFSQADSRGACMGLGAHMEIAMPHLVRFGTAAQKARWLPDLIAGRKVAALGITEPGAGSNVSALATIATRRGDGWVLRGEKMFITNSLHADVFCIAAKTDPAAGHRGISMFLLPRETPGFHARILTGKLGRRASDTGHLTLDDCTLPADALLGSENQGFYQVMQCFEHERLCISAGCVGAAEACLEDARQFASERRMAGGRLIDMQVTRQRLAKSYAELEAARQLVYTSAWRVVRGIPSLKQVAMTKAVAAESCWRIIDDCLQLHGGRGYFNDCRVERIFRDVRLDRIGGGATEVMYDIIAKQLAL